MAISPEIFERATKAKADQVTAATELWNARLELLQNVGDVRGILDQLLTPVELAGDNCGCNSACAAPESLGGRIGIPAASQPR